MQRNTIQATDSRHSLSRQERARSAEHDVREAISFFREVPKITNRLRVLDDVGLGYLRLGQSATTLSGGEAQRIKLAAHLLKRTGAKTLYIFDEPTTGLHFDDINKLLAAFRALIEAGGSLLVIEHNLDVIKTADHVIDLGAEGGDAGGYVVGTGTPEEIMKLPGFVHRANFFASIWQNQMATCREMVTASKSQDRQLSSADH